MIYRLYFIKWSYGNVKYLIATNGVLVSIINAIPKNRSPTPGFRMNMNKGSIINTKMQWCTTVAGEERKNVAMNYFIQKYSLHLDCTKILYTNVAWNSTLFKEWMFWLIFDMSKFKLMDCIKPIGIGNKVRQKYPKIYLNSFASTSIHNIYISIFSAAYKYYIYSGNGGWACL